MQLAELNSLSDIQASESFSQTCGASRWVDAMVGSRPFESEASIYEAASRQFHGLEESDWLEAFQHHPRIGDVDSLREKFASTAAWAGKEQGSVNDADESVIHNLKAANDKYFDHFGFIFIVCATGKSAAEMLAILEGRIGNDRSDEIGIAAAEQIKITKLRLEKLLS